VLRTTILSAVPPGTQETISYNMPAYRHGGVLVWFGAFRDHCSFFPTAAIITEFGQALKGFTTTKGAIHFAAGNPLPAELVTAMVRARAEKVSRKTRPKGKV